MKRLIYILPFIIFLQLNAQTFSSGQKWADFHTNKNALSHHVPANIQKHFDIAINEINQMLKGEKPLSFKKAVFLVENAYYEGKMSWEDYNNEILRIKPILNKMIDNRNLRQYKTAGNWAVFTYMSDSIPENNFKPYQYDFENFMQDIYKMDLIGFGKNVLLYYGITVVVYGAASYLICSLRYARAKKSLKCYYNNLKKLNSIYNE